VGDKHALCGESSPFFFFPLSSSKAFLISAEHPFSVDQLFLTRRLAIAFPTDAIFSAIIIFRLRTLPTRL